MEASGGQPLRPLNFGQVLDVGFNVFFKNLKPLLLTVAVVVIPVQVIAVLVQFSTIPAAFEPANQEQLAADPSQAPQVATDELVIFAIGSVVSLIFTLVGALFATAACFKAINDAYLGERPGWRESLRYAFSRWRSILWLGFLVFGALLAAFVAFAFITGLITGLLGPLGLVLVLGLVVGFLYVLTLWSLAVPALLLEDVRGTKALGRSARLVKGRWWFTFGILVMAAVISFVVQLILALLFSIPVVLAPENLLVNAVTQIAAGAVSTTLSTPLYAAFVVVLYLDHRVRKEGFDLELLAQRIGVAPDRARTGSPYIRPAPPAYHPPPSSPPPPEGDPPGSPPR